MFGLLKKNKTNLNNFNLCLKLAPGASQAVISYEKLQQLQENVSNNKAKKNERLTTMTPCLHNISNEG